MSTFGKALTRRAFLGRFEEFVEAPARFAEQVTGLVEQGRTAPGRHCLQHQMADHFDDRLLHRRPPLAAGPGHSWHQGNDRAVFRRRHSPRVPGRLAVSPAHAGLR